MFLGLLPVSRAHSLRPSPLRVVAPGTGLGQLKGAPVTSSRVHTPPLPTSGAGREREAGKDHRLDGRGQKPGAPWVLTDPGGASAPHLLSAVSAGTGRGRADP